MNNKNTVIENYHNFQSQYKVINEKYIFGYGGQVYVRTNEVNHLRGLNDEEFYELNIALGTLISLSTTLTESCAKYFYSLDFDIGIKPSRNNVFYSEINNCMSKECIGFEFMKSIRHYLTHHSSQIITKRNGFCFFKTKELIESENFQIKSSVLIDEIKSGKINGDIKWGLVSFTRVTYLNLMVLIYLETKMSTNEFSEIYQDILGSYVYMEKVYREIPNKYPYIKDLYLAKEDSKFSFIITKNNDFFSYLEPSPKTESFLNGLLEI